MPWNGWRIQTIPALATAVFYLPFPTWRFQVRLSFLFYNGCTFTARLRTAISQVGRVSNCPSNLFFLGKIYWHRASFYQNFISFIYVAGSKSFKKKKFWFFQNSLNSRKWKILFVLISTGIINLILFVWKKKIKSRMSKNIFSWNNSKILFRSWN